MPKNTASIAAAKQLLETTLSQLDQDYDSATPAGLGVTVAWGLPYFQAYIPMLKQKSVYFRLAPNTPITFRSITAPPTPPGQAGSLFTVTSIRKGFAGGGQSLPKQMALSGGVPRCRRHPRLRRAVHGLCLDAGRFHRR